MQFLSARTVLNNIIVLTIRKNQHCLLSSTNYTDRFRTTQNLLKRVIKMNTNNEYYNLLLKQIAPPLSSAKHKGQAGRVGIFGGSLEYTGAPYFAAISCLRVGADLAHVFCTRDAAPVIKSYSPELIVHPLLDNDQDAISHIQPWLDRLHTILIGPGLGRDDSTFDLIEKVISLCSTLRKPLIIDADGLFLISQKPHILKDYDAPVILTPNSAEFHRLVGEAQNKSTERKQQAESILNLTKDLTIVIKGAHDEIINSVQTVTVDEPGSGRRCGGQGDLLAGSLATFLTWTLDGRNSFKDAAILAAYSACMLTRVCNRYAFEKKGRSMLVSDMIEEIHNVFLNIFENE